MATIDLGKVRETVTGTVLKSGSTSSGSTAKWAITTDLQPNGVGEFSVYNGADGQDGQDGAPGKNGADTIVWSGLLSMQDLLSTIQSVVNDVNKIVCFLGYTSTSGNGGPFNVKQLSPYYSFLGGSPSSSISSLDSITLYDANGYQVSPSFVGFMYYAESQGIADNSIITDKLSDGAVTTGKIASEAVTNAKIKVVEVAPPKDTLANFLAFFYNLYNNHPEARIKFHNNVEDHYYPLLFRADIADDTIEFIKIFPNTFDSISSVLLVNNEIIFVTGGQDFDNYVQDFADYITVLKYAD